MISKLLQKIFGSRNQRLIARYRKQVAAINALESSIKPLTDAQLSAKTTEFRERVAQGETLDALLPEAFAVCREASLRVLSMRHFDMQLIGGIALHEGKIAEMRTGEGKTLVATLAAYLNALSGKGVHVVTVNDYLATRDSEWMGRLYQFLGLTIGLNLSHMSHEEKRQAYAADITYGTNNEFGFDYLRDNMVYELEGRVQRELNFAVVDEVDSILIDEARTPLIISGQSEDHTDWYARMNALPAALTLQIGEEKADGTGVEMPGDYTLDEKSRQVFLTELGHEKAETLLAKWGLLPAGQSLYAPQNIALMHHVYAALRAHTLFHRDQHYVVQDGEVVIVDEFTGRLMAGRRWSDGLHQAVEAKEGVAIQNENQTLASITFQNYFRMYATLSGMTGTADTEAYEFQEIYSLETVVIPTNRPSQRIDRQDQIYKTSKERYEAVIRDIRTCYEQGQPVLVGTTSIENSELLSTLLEQAKLPHQVLNAKQHAREAEIIAQAGRPKMITIATNMAGRGTDIVLGGNVGKQAGFIEANEELSSEEKQKRIAQLHDEWQSLHDQVKAAGGLHIIGTERHESRRIDNQLRGRAGRQGDPGSSRFYLSLDDALLRIFAGPRVRAIMERLKMPDGEAIEAGIVTRSIESAQRKVEARNFDIRKQLLEYDDVSNDQRQVIYRQRNAWLGSSDVSNTIGHMREAILTDIVHQFVPPESIEEQWDLPGLERALHKEWHLWPEVSNAPKAVAVEASTAAPVLPTNSQDALKQFEAAQDAEHIVQIVLAAAEQTCKAKIAVLGEESIKHLERSLLLQTLDAHWREHLSALDHLRQGIHLRGYAQKNPKQEYKRESLQLFASLLDAISFEVTQTLMQMRVEIHADLPEEEGGMRDPLWTQNLHTPMNLQFQHADNPPSEMSETLSFATESATPHISPKIGRNALCPCESGKKYKHCHGQPVLQ